MTALSKLKSKVLFPLLSLTLLSPVSYAAKVTNSSESNNAIGFKLMQENFKQESSLSENVMLSPLSAQMAISMLYNGATNESAKTLSSFMGFGELATVSTLNSENQSRMQKLIKPPVTDLCEFCSKPVVLKIANSAFSTNGNTDGRKYNFQDSFLKSLGAYYSVTTPPSLDFQSSEAADTINQWASDNTEGMVPEIISHEELQNFLWVLMNATYLEGTWKNSFIKIPAAPPQQPNFTTLDGKKITTNFMTTMGGGYFKYLASDNFEAIELPLNGTRAQRGVSPVKAYVILPSSTDEFKAMSQGTESLWTSGFWNKLFKEIDHSYGTLKMPTFSFDYTLTLKKDSPMTEALGLTQIFSSQASFDNMDQKDGLKSKVGLIKQSTKIEWDEKGLKAAAVTIIGGLERAISNPPISFNMVVDKPFYFAIYDEETKSFLFLGSVVQP